MSDIGQTLRAARERKKVSCSKAAAETRMKVQHIEALERNDFAYMAAPMYVRGFIKLYAAYLELDPEPLLRDYMEHHAPRGRPSLMGDDNTPPRGPVESVWRRELARAWRRAAARAKEWRRAPAGRPPSGAVAEEEPALRHAPSAKVWIALGAVALLGLLLARWAFREESEAPRKTPAAAVDGRAPARPERPLLAEPPDPYMAPGAQHGAAP